GPLAPFGVATVEEALCGCGRGPGPIGEPGDPAGHEGEGAVEEAVKEHAIQPVQQAREGGGTCMAAAFARSLSWLNDEYDAGSRLTAQQMHDSLVKSGVVHSATTSDDSLIARKTRWADREFQGRIVAKIVDVEN